LPILVVAPTWIGDFVRNQSLIKILAKRHLGRPIDVLTNSVCQPLGSFMPEVRRTWTLDVAKGQLGLGARWQLGRRLRNEGYGTAVIVMGSIKAALVPFFAGIKERIGWIGESRYILLTDLRKGEKTFPRIVDRFTRLGLARDEEPPAKWPMPSLTVPQADIDAWLRRAGMLLRDDPVIAMAPGSNSFLRQWPIEYFAELARMCRDRGWRVWVLGAANEKNMAAVIRDHAGSGCVDFTGADLHDAAIQLSLSTAVVSNDSGLLHVAAALERPTVALFGPTPPDMTGPLNPQVVFLEHKTDCQYCWDYQCPLGHHRCMRDLRPNGVFETLDGIVNDLSVRRVA